MMNRPVILLALLLSVVSASAAEAGLEFSGVMGSGRETRVALTNKSNGVTQWVAVGATYAGYVVSSYDPKLGTLVVTKNGQSQRLALKQGKVAAAAAGKTPQEIERAILNNLRQLAAAADQFYLENGKTVTSYENLVGPDKYVKNIVPVANENYRALQFVQGRTLVVTTSSGHSVSYNP